jgi:hypothetical protein
MPTVARNQPLSDDEREFLEPSHTVTIRHRSFPVHFIGRTAGGVETGKMRRAMRGDVVEVNEHDYQRGLALGAFVEKDEETGEVVLEVSTASVAELAEWIAEDKPSINSLLEEANGDAALAQRLLDAENEATGGQPRKGLVEGLTEVIARANS